MAPKDYTVDFPSVHEDDHASCSSCESVSDEPTKTKKSVHFNPACHLKFYPMPTQEDKFNAWYEISDYQSFKTNAKMVVNAAEEGKIVAGEEMIFGLESATRARADLKRQRRCRIWDIVVDGQFDHTAQNVAEFSSLASYESAREAERAASLLRLSLLPQQEKDHHTAEAKKGTRLSFSRITRTATRLVQAPVGRAA